MTQVTERGELLSSASADQRGRAAALTASFLRGGLAAGLGVGALAVAVMALWISSPYPDSGPDGALHVAVALWLLGNGVELARPGAMGGGSAPIGVVPLLLAVAPVYLAYRCAREALEPEHGRPQLTMIGAMATVSGGYLLFAVAAVVYTSSGPLTVSPLRALLVLPPLVLAATGAGAWSGSGHPLPPIPAGLPRLVRGLLRRTLWSRAARRRTALAARAAVASTTVLLGGGAILAGASLVLHGHEAHDAFVRLSTVWSGRFAVLLLGLVLVPNAAVWAACYGLGPGFALGTGVVVGPLGLLGGAPGTGSVAGVAGSGNLVVPSFPLLAAVPSGADPRPPLLWAVLAVPAAAGVAAGWFTARVAAPARAEGGEAWGAGATAAAAATAALGAAALTALLAAASGGPIGVARLAQFGPCWWAAGGATLVWTLVLGVPTALIVRAWRLYGSPYVGRRAARAKGEQGGTGAGAAGSDATGHAGGSKAERAGSKAGKVGERRRTPTPARGGHRDGPTDAASADGTVQATRDAYEFLDADSWHERGVREARLASLGPATDEEGRPAAAVSPAEAGIRALHRLASEADATAGSVASSGPSASAGSAAPTGSAALAASAAPAGSSASAASAAPGGSSASAGSFASADLPASADPFSAADASAPGGSAGWEEPSAPAGSSAWAGPSSTVERDAGIRSSVPGSSGSARTSGSAGTSGCASPGPGGTFGALAPDGFGASGDPGLLPRADSLGAGDRGSEPGGTDEPGPRTDGEGTRESGATRGAAGASGGNADAGGWAPGTGADGGT